MENNNWEFDKIVRMNHHKLIVL